MAHLRGSGQRRADMAIATKNGVPIVRDGKIATNCGCCDSWLCCPDPACLRLTATLYVTVTPSGASPIPSTPYVGRFAVPFMGVEASSRLGGRTLRWIYRFDVNETCVDARIEFVATHAVGGPVSSTDTRWEMSIFCNSRSFAEGEQSQCQSVRLRYPPQDFGAFSSGTFWCAQPGFFFAPGTGSYESTLLGKSFRVSVEFVEN